MGDLRLMGNFYKKNTNFKKLIHSKKYLKLTYAFTSIFGLF